LALIEDYGLDKLAARVTKPLKGLRIAPFYGCYLLRPGEALGFDDYEKPTSLERLITVLGGKTMHYDGETKCCGFPILFVQQGTALSMTASYLDNAKRAGADFVVTPCPLCHLSLDTYQRKAEKKANVRVELPVVHLSQLIGMALGVKPEKLGFNKHMVSIEKVVQKWK
jgi:succinate dehydrogenase / fumarate reductase cytochrome b subunit